ncbi:MAG: 2-ketoisovalerate ferredoxin oxidoreductase subunit delta [Syntrophorhabdus sp. PtaU1.Bin002]|nr:MAG: 2-ketoisovalerate ferredoxin oxidoreductase subunit delta [Syntrophorhabdus sp. PtaB.Bin006]OPY72306.1 MAG: 2-ketoisovalerate ferredoxin oxidoreductase subunit delta [Syntrophorhabdus sp. PtaU1.Bin002]
MMPILNKELCSGCGNCVEVCPPQAIVLKDDKAHIEVDYCEECGFCVAECLVDALQIRFPLSTDKV